MLDYIAMRIRYAVFDALLYVWLIWRWLKLKVGRDE
jgi:hypothetical protein